jgi:hypothetical protein
MNTTLVIKFNSLPKELIEYIKLYISDKIYQIYRIYVNPKYNYTDYDIAWKERNRYLRNYY